MGFSYAFLGTQWGRQHGAPCPLFLLVCMGHCSLYIPLLLVSLETRMLYTYKAHKRTHLYPEDGGIIYFRNVSNITQKHTD
jgi:hypothetical protein